jgi:parvulin-like peptidyl-prolyl isomerase
MFDVKDNATQQVKDEKKNLADQALARIKKGEDFEAVAKEVSQDMRTKNRGGNAGLFARGKRTDLYGEAFEKQAFSLPLTTVSDVFQGKNGYYIIKVMEKKPQEQETFEEVKQRIERTLKTEKQKTAMDSYLEGLKKKYSVKILDESMK